MSSPEKPPSPPPANLLTKQVPWGARKSASSPIAVKPPTAPLSAKHVPWGVAKAAAKSTPPAPVPPAPDAASALSAPFPGPTAAPKPSFVARLVPWGARKTPPPPPPPASKLPEPGTETATWALPRGTDSSSPHSALEAARESLRHEAASSGEPTAEELVAILSKRLARTREKREVEIPENQPYRARPISFSATRWDVVKLWASAHRLGLAVAAAGVVFILGALELSRLVSLNTKIDHEWHDLEAVLRQRYALAPDYVACIASYSTEERYTVALTQKRLTAWRNAQTDQEIVLSAERMEQVLTLLARVMRRYDHNGVAKDDDQIESSRRFAALEDQRRQTLARLRDTAHNYNESVGKLDAQVEAPPGSWIAWIGKVQPRLPFNPTGHE